MKRGFKTEARRLALDVRSELGLDALAPFDVVGWAQLYGVPLLALRDLPCGDRARERFSGDGASVWSAALIPNGTGQVIIYNSCHGPARIKSDVTHEAAHVLLEHPNVTSVSMNQGCAREPELEEEANELAGELLLPTSAAHRMARRRLSDREVGLMFGISAEMARWRLNSTGARLIARRREEAYRRSMGA
jgi:hypothetical protein